MIGTINEILFRDGHLDYDKYVSLKELISNGNEREFLHHVDSGISSMNSNHQDLVNALRVELLMKDVKSNETQLESIFKKLLASSGGLKNCVNSTDERNILGGRILLFDLYSDLQYLSFGGVSSHLFMGLINRKLTLLGSLSGDEEKLYPFIAKIYVKVIKLCLVAEFHFSKHNIMRTLDEKLGLSSQKGIDKVAVLVHESLSDNTREMFCRFLNDKFVSFPQFKDFLKRSDIFVEIPFLLLDEETMTSHFLENGIYTLSNHYKNIKMHKILDLLEIETDIDVEEFVLQMIIKRKLPDGTYIDQMYNSVAFGKPEAVYNEFETRIKEVCDLVELISDGIHLGTF